MLLRAAYMQQRREGAVSDIIIDHDHRLGPKPPSQRQRISTRVLAGIAWTLATILLGLIALSGALTACAQLQCWTL